MPWSAARRKRSAASLSCDVVSRHICASRTAELNGRGEDGWVTGGSLHVTTWSRGLPRAVARRVRELCSEDVHDIEALRSLECAKMNKTKRMMGVDQKRQDKNTYTRYIHDKKRNETRWGAAILDKIGKIHALRLDAPYGSS